MEILLVTVYIAQKHFVKVLRWRSGSKASLPEALAGRICVSSEV